MVPLESQPVQFHASGSLGVLTVDQQPHIAQRFGLYGQLRDLAAGGSVIVPERSILDPYTLVHYARLEVDVQDYSAKLTRKQAEALLENTRFSGDGEIVGREVRPYVVVATSEEIGTMRVVLFKDTVFVVEESLYATVVEATP
mgnify:CR=1 FL=1